MNIRTFWNSIRVKVLLVSFVICIPIFILLFWINNYSIALMQQHIYENNLDTLRLHMKQFDSEMSKVSNYLMTEYEAGSHIADFTSNDKLQQYEAGIYYAGLLQHAVARFDYIEGLMLYSHENKKGVYGFNRNSTSYDIRKNVIDYIETNGEDVIGNNGLWRTYEIDGQSMLLCAVGNKNVLFCAWTSYDTLLLPVESWNLNQSSHTCFTSLEGKVRTELNSEELEHLDYNGNMESYYFSGPKNKYLMIGISSEVGDFRMANAVERNKVLGVFYIIRILGIVILLLFLFLLVPFLVVFLNKSIFSPIHRLEKGIEKLEKGNLDVQIENYKSSYEITHLIDSFNNMISQIKNLKIQSYEEAIEKKQLELNYLLLQVEPHFYLNALNLINTMAQVNDTEMIRQLTENLSLYLRYIVSTRNGYTTIENEVEHIGHYLKIMELRFDDRFHYDETVEKETLQVKIPPLLIQMLIENSMKYAFDVYGDTRIRLIVKRADDELVIIVQDNGNGYPEKILEAFRLGRAPEGQHVGLWNIKMRLEYMYKNHTSFLLSNLNPHGAKTEIRIKGREDHEFTNCR